MTQFLPPNLLALFAARDPIPFKTPAAQLSWEKDRARNPYTGVSTLTPLFEEPKDTPPPTRGETKSEKKSRRIKEKAILRAKEVEEEAKNYDPHNNREATGDAFKTLFIARINYDTSESKLRREFDMYGPIRKINMVKDSSGKPRGYAFIEFEHERDMHTAYKNADGKKIDGRRVLVDVERGRTVKGWRPRRLGGGLGSTRQGANEENVRQSGRDAGRPERGDERREMARSGSRDRRRSSRDRDRRDNRRDRDRGDRGERGDRERKRDRGDRDRDRDRDRRDKDKDRDESSKDKGRDRDRADRKHRNRDRSKERDRDGSRRKRSRDRDRKDRDRSDRDKDKDKDRRSRSDKDRKEDDDSKREPKSEYPNEEVKREDNNGDVDQKPSYDDADQAPVDGMKQELAYQEPNGEKGQGDYQNSDGMRGSPSGSADMEY